MKKILVLLFIVVAQKANCQYWLIFYADTSKNAGTAGHGFVSFVRQDKSIKQTILDGCWGFYPRSNSIVKGVLSAIVPIEGAIGKDINRQREFGFTVKVSTDEYNSALKTKDEWTSKKYMVSGQNCKDFIYAVANNIKELIQPSQFWRYPTGYINDLKRLNSNLEVTGPLESDDQETSTPSNFTYYPFKMNPEYVTHASDNTFKWYTWGKAPGEINTAAMDVYVIDRINNVITLAHELDSLSNVWRGAVQVAAIDLDNNGICGLAVQLGASIPNQEFFPFLICEDGYLKSYYVDWHKEEKEPKPADLVDSIKPNTVFTGIKDSTIKYFHYNKINDNSVPYSDKPVGGKTPFDLGRLLLQALKANNKSLWLACIHPDAEPRMASMIIDAFDYFRNGLTENGIEDWSLIEFSRATFTQNQGSQFPSVQHGNKAVYYLSVEFYYNHKEFLGEFSLGGAETYKDGNWFIRTPGSSDFKYGRNVFK